jgi:hypothetical protein
MAEVLASTYLLCNNEAEREIWDAEISGPNKSGTAFVTRFGPATMTVIDDEL